MSTAAPPVDPRDAAAVRRELIEQLQARVPELASGEPNQASAALIEVFTRFCAIVVDRLNRAPDKNFLAYLDLLGVAPVPPQPARVPLTFTLSTGSLVDAVVPTGTQVAAPPTEGEKDPVVFETERELTVVAAKLQTVLAVDPSRDLVADHTALVTSPVEAGVTIFGGEQPSENFTRHYLYVGHPSLALEGTSQVDVDLRAAGVDDPDASGLSSFHLFWEQWNGTACSPASTLSRGRDRSRRAPLPASRAAGCAASR
jgi:hypothetical protein